MEENRECSSCEEVATIVCFDCRNYFCESCFKDSHKKAKSSKHKNEKISPLLPIEIYCLKHNKNQIISFCLDDKGNK